MDIGGRKMAGLASGVIDSFQIYVSRFEDLEFSRCFVAEPDDVSDSGAVFAFEALKEIQPAFEFLFGGAQL